MFKSFANGRKHGVSSANLFRSILRLYRNVAMIAAAYSTSTVRCLSPVVCRALLQSGVHLCRTVPRSLGALRYSH